MKNLKEYKEYKFVYENVSISIMAYSYEGAMFKLIEITKHPSDYEYLDGN